ncbi:hypothetical protein D9756_005411 [Leucocoprinus leucothites]|uniref:40S ribosomal protein S8 n=1 Tax=Leucocoprinus leucothites TaxID=201217 RepID=A0A8H5D9M0_9AGAR|nr:hypothetical protein D9756_005411 [Leucoagaricus leucothites]
MGISRSSRHKRSASGAQRAHYRKKRKFELGRQPANTKLGPKRIHSVRVRGGNVKYRALRLDGGNFAWGSEHVTKKTRIIGVVYNASNNELVRTNTLVKSAIIQVDATPFRQWYELHPITKKGKSQATEAAAEDPKKLSNHAQRNLEERKKDAKIDPLLEAQFGAGRLYAAISSRPGQSGRADGYILEGKELECLRATSPDSRPKQLWLCGPLAALPLVGHLHFFGVFGVLVMTNHWLIVHSVNIAFAFKFTSLFPIPGVLCVIWLVYQIAATYIFLNAIDAVLMIRIYGFYHRNWKMGVFLCALFAIRFSLAIIIIAIHPPSQVDFDENCGIHMPKPVVFCFLVSEMISQSIILGLTFAQQAFAPEKLPRAPTPVVSVFYRDGIMTYAAVLVWIRVFISILTSATCRIIINMRQLAENNGSVEPFELTSILETSEERTTSSLPA